MDKAIYSMQIRQHTIVSIIIIGWEGNCSSFASLWSCVGLCGLANVLQCGIAKTPRFFFQRGEKVRWGKI
jgi:hypothetical protein